MASTHIDIDTSPWTVGTTFCGQAAIYEGKELVQVKMLSDRRDEGGGSAWLVKFSPPPGKLIKIIATAQSDEHVFNLEGGRGTKTGQPVRSSGGYAEPKGTTAQRFHRPGDRRVRRLFRRTGRSPFAGSRRYRAGRRGQLVTADPVLILTSDRNPQAEAVVTGGLA